MKKIENIRKNYNLETLRKSDLSNSPIKQFESWFNDIINNKDIIEPTAVNLSTYDVSNGINSRVVLLKGLTKEGFIFYTNYNSLKATQIENNENVHLCFFWPVLQRQVRVKGSAIKISENLSSKYFQSRPRKSKIAAWTSEQSMIIKSRLDLDSRFLYYENKFKDKKIPKPESWGGYKVIPNSMEFWQGRENRLHDRFLYLKQNKKWIIKRLAP